MSLDADVRQGLRALLSRGGIEGLDRYQFQELFWALCVDEFSSRRRPGAMEWEQVSFRVLLQPRPPVGKDHT